MRTISCICQKGGTGKTTLALSLATEAAAAGRSVVVVDLDPQASACEWSDLRGADADDSGVVVIDAQPARVEAVVEKAREGGVDLVLIDTAGRTEQAALAGSRVADLVLIPLQPSVVDLKTVQATVDLIRLGGGAPHAVVLMRVKPLGARASETSDWLGQLDIPVCPATIGDRVAFQDAFALGRGVCEYEPEGKAAGEVRQVYCYASQQVGL